MSHWLKLAAILSLIAMPSLAGEDEGLYAPPPPAGAAWIRYLGEGSVAVGALNQVSSEYQMLIQGRYSVNQQSAVASLAIEAGKRYTLSSLGNRQLNLLTDPQLENRARALLVLYNFTDKPMLDLVTAEGLKVIENVATEANGSRMVQPVSVKLAVAFNGVMLKTLDEAALERGASYSIIATGRDDAITAEMTRNATKETN